MSKKYYDSYAGIEEAHFQSKDGGYQKREDEFYANSSSDNEIDVESDYENFEFNCCMLIHEKPLNAYARGVGRVFQARGAKVKMIYVDDIAHNLDQEDLPERLLKNCDLVIIPAEKDTRRKDVVMLDKFYKSFLRYAIKNDITCYGECAGA